MAKKNQDKPSLERGLRSPVSPAEVRGVIRLPDQTASEAVLFWNISDQGLGIWIPAALPVGAPVEIELFRPQKLTLGAEVRWCRPIPSRSGFLIGLLVTEQVAEFMAVHRAIQSASQTGKAS